MTSKKVLFWLTLIIIPLCLMGGSTIVQAVPLAALLVILYKELNGEDLKVGGLVLSIVMLVINMIPEVPSEIDVIFWAVSAGVFALSSKSKK